VDLGVSKSNVAKEDRPVDNRRRDAAYLFCGLVMIGSVLWAVSSLITHAPILLPETIAIVAFATSWLVKGEAHQPVVSVVRRWMTGRTHGRGTGKT
jgi:hypothetical protein